MALDRQSIEKKDFPIGRRGYDPDAVDAHLSALAEEVSDFKRSARRRSDTLASSASDQVRAIVEAAETSAADIQRDAETEAREIRQEASTEAQTTREEATEQAREYISKVSESTAAMLERIDAMESELSSLVDTLRTSGNRLDSDLRLLETNLSEVGEAVSPRHQFEAEDEDETPASFDRVRWLLRGRVGAARVGASRSDESLAGEEEHRDAVGRGASHPGRVFRRRRRRPPDRAQYGAQRHAPRRDGQVPV